MGTSAGPPLRPLAVLVCLALAGAGAQAAQPRLLQPQGAPAPAAALELAWADEFDHVDPASWSFETGGHGWGNQELQYYTAGQNAFVQYDTMAGSSVLVIEARRGAPAGTGCWYGACQYSSSRMVTHDRREFRHGRIEARIRLPQTQGIWPAFWMLGANFDLVGWPNSGEIDIMEHVGFEPTLIHGALHGPGYSGNTPLSGTHDLGEPADAGYRVYAVEWDADGIDWFVDGLRFYGITRAQVEAHGPWVFDQPFFLLLNVAVGGQWPGHPDATSVFPQRMYVDYVRVYQAPGPRRRSVGSQPLAPPGAAASPAAAPRAAAGAAPAGVVRPIPARGPANVPAQAPIGPAAAPASRAPAEAPRAPAERNDERRLLRPELPQPPLERQAVP